ncbi:phytolongin Phyl2.2 [Prunus yedoensis var. nudiflora]|uniref:Phytolongin Phyl2.2 n=1 Tax=Prunus yedoensis var. nudiflora TaxID=2094558 RepID=A0A314YCS8_PRUYE|nr:phytolongin Phyl2.2 [Prunus yedoensis var. nudiflora]
MISNPNLIYYACIAHKITIIGEFSKEPGLGPLVQQCIEITPPHHSMYTHTSEALSFLNRLKCDFEEANGSGSILVRDNYASHCFQAQFDSIIRKIMASDLELPNSPPASRNLSLSSSKGKKLVLTPLLGKKTSEGLKKKKRLSGELNGDVGKDMTTMEKKVDVCDDVNGGFRDFSLQTQKNGPLLSGDSSALTVELADLEGCGVFLGDVSVVYCAFAIL